MARRKQVAVRRESSSEYFNKETATWEDASGKKIASNGHAKGSSSSSSSAPEAGVLQLVISVVGIYASL